jgi:hypothetical protein
MSKKVIKAGRWLLFPTYHDENHDATHVAVFVNDAVRQIVRDTRKAHDKLFESTLDDCHGSIQVLGKTPAVIESRVYSSVPADIAEQCEERRGSGLVMPADWTPPIVAADGVGGWESVAGTGSAGVTVGSGWLAFLSTDPFSSAEIAADLTRAFEEGTTG